MQQKNTATPIIKDPATPDATETPMTVPGLTCFGPSSFEAGGEPVALVKGDPVLTMSGTTADPDDGG